MRLYQVTDHATGEVYNIEAESASIAGSAFQKEGRSVTIKPITEEVIKLDTTTNKEAEMPKVHNKYKNTAPPDAVYIGRGSKWGNPFVIDKHGTRSEVIAKYKEYILGKPELLAQLHELKGKDVVCYCAPQACHGDILVHMANNPEEGTTMATKPTYHIAFTGHRPNKIGGYDETSPKRFALRQKIQETLQRAVVKYGTTHEIIVISGGALGVDQDAARVAHKMNIPFIVAQPCKNHESRWFKESQIKYRKMLEIAREVVLVSNGTYDELGAKCMQDRNIWMVDHCNVLIAVWDGSSGGTANCVNYAKSVNKPIVYINPNDLGGGGGEPVNTPNDPKEGPTMDINPEPINPEEGPTMPKKQKPPADALKKCEMLSPEELQWITNKLEENILPHLVADVSNYAKGRLRTWLPYEAPLDAPNSTARPFVPGLLDDEVWQWIVDLCAKHGFKAETALISKGGNIKPHRDTTYAAAWAMGINLGSCNWHIASSRDMATPNFTMDLTGGEVFKFNSKHVHAVTNADSERWAINVWAIADTNAARNADVRGRLETMLENHPEVAEFIDYHQPGASKPITEEVNKMDTNPVNKTTNPKEGKKMIKEYLVRTPSLIESATVPTEMVYSRIITNDPEYAFGAETVKPVQVGFGDGRSLVIETTDPGGYHWFMLDHMFGNQSFAINITPYESPFRFPGMPPEPQLGALAGDNKPEDVIFGWGDFDAEYMLRVKGHKSSKYSDMSEYGLAVGNSAKMTKRLTEIIRAARGGMVNIKGKHKMARILVLSHYDILDFFPHLNTEEVAAITLDGISLITDDYAKKVYLANKYLPGKAKYRTLKGMEDRKVTNHTLRVVTCINGQPGMVKGNALSVPKDAMLARLRERGMISSTQVVDIVTTVDNFKQELGTNGSWEIITLEPHHGPGMVKTNDQTLAQFKGIEGIFEYQHLLENFKSVLDNAYNNMVEGKDIKWMQNIVAERVTNEADKFAAIKGGKVTNNLNKMIASLHEVGLDIGVSQTLMFMRAQGIKKMFLSDNKEEGLNWQANAREKKSFVFMPHAYRAYVMTKEVLWLAGYDIDLNDKQSFYHEETQTFCMPGITWAKIQGKLGGADLDDEVMIHERRYVRPDGSVNPLVAFLVRTPNDWAEFAILDLAEPGPTFLNEGDIPTIHSKDLAKFKRLSVAGSLPSATIGSNRPAPAIWDWDSSVYNYATSFLKSGGVGGQVKTKMLQYGINNVPFASLPCANEDMIDALQQCKGTDDDLRVLAAWSANATMQVLQSRKMDSYWWYSRNMFDTAKALKKNHGLGWWHKPLDEKQSPIVQEFMIPREEMVRETHQEMINFLNRNIMEIPELENIFKDKKQEMHYRRLITQISKLFIVPQNRDAHGNLTEVTKSHVADHMQGVSIQLLERMESYEKRSDVEQTNLHILRMVRASYLVKQGYPGANYDRWLYTAANDSDVIMTDYFVRALTWFRTK